MSERCLHNHVKGPKDFPTFIVASRSIYKPRLAMRKFLLASIAFVISNILIAQNNYPLFSIEINKTTFQVFHKEEWIEKKLHCYIIPATATQNFDQIVLENTSSDTLEIRNLVPYGVNNDHVYITGLGEHGLSRTHLFIPGKTPVNLYFLYCALHKL